MPDGQSAGCIGGVGESGDSLSIGARGPRAVGDDDERAHLVVDVAAERHHARLFEMNRSRLIPGEQLQLEPLRRREGIYVVLGRIEVRERHVRADGDNGQERMKLDIFLRDHEAAGSARGAGGIARWIKGDDGVSNRASGGIEHSDRERGRSKGSGQASASRDQNQSTNHAVRLNGGGNRRLCEHGYQCIRTSA